MAVHGLLTSIATSISFVGYFVGYVPLRRKMGLLIKQATANNGQEFCSGCKTWAKSRHLQASVCLFVRRNHVYSTQQGHNTWFSNILSKQNFCLWVFCLSEFFKLRTFATVNLQQLMCHEGVRSNIRPVWINNEGYRVSVFTVYFHPLKRRTKFVPETNRCFWMCTTFGKQQIPSIAHMEITNFGYSPSSWH